MLKGDMALVLAPVAPHQIGSEMKDFGHDSVTNRAVPHRVIAVQGKCRLKDTVLL
jgi:hypothetical protein